MTDGTPQKAVLLINLGTPAGPDKKAIRQFLREMLSDPKVMDVPTVLRWSILHLFILPFRPGRIVNKYQQIWTEEGFPLIEHGRNLERALSQELGSSYHVQLAMRYGSPSIKSALDILQNKGIQDVFILPLFPQYATATTESALEQVFRIADNGSSALRIKYKKYFYDQAGFIDCWVNKGRNFLTDHPDHVLFSFHGLPVKQILALDYTGNNCLKSDTCCNLISEQNQFCYRAQCVQTAKKIANGLGISDNKFSISFQSRLGRTQWLEPYTSSVVQKLALNGTKNLLVFCPSFVADCLETSYEVEVEEKERFISNGGERLTIVPSLNSDAAWVKAVCTLVRDADQG